MPLDRNRLETLLDRQGTEADVAAFFRGASESERQSLASLSLKRLQDAVRGQAAAWSKGDFSDPLPIGPASVAAHATCGWSPIDKLGWRARLDGDPAYDVLSDRKPAWITDWAERVCREARRASWPVIRRLMREGLCRRPTHDNYIRLMIDSFDRNDAEAIVRRLKDDPTLLDDEVWRIFEIPGIMQNESMLGYPVAAWAPALAKLASEGKLDRGRLFRAIFAAPSLGFNRNQIKVLLQVHDELKPTIDERIEMARAYATLTGSELPPAASFGFDNLAALDDLHPQPAATFAELLRSTLRQPTKGLALRALERLQKVVQRDPSAGRAVALVATEGLLHPQVSVQEKAWKLIERSESDDAQVDAELRRLFATVSPSVRKRIDGYLKARQTGDPPKTKSSVTSGSSAGQAAAERQTARRTNRGATGSGVRESAAQGRKAAESDSRELLDAETTGLLQQAGKVEKRLALALGLPDLISAVRSGKRVLPPCRFDGTELARLPHAEPLVPIESLDELIETAAAVLEDGARVDDGERVLEGLTRFPLNSPRERSAAEPVLKRAIRMAKRDGGAFLGIGVHLDLPFLLMAWSGNPETIEAGRVQLQGIEKELRKAKIHPGGFPGFLSKRRRELCERLSSGTPTILVGTPTHAGGWIDPNRLVDRIGKSPEPSSMFLLDQVAALLRLAPDGRNRALKRTRGLKGEFSAALRHALGSGSEKIGPTAPLWIAAARARAPFEDDPAVERAFPRYGPDAALAARYAIRTEVKQQGTYVVEKTSWYADDSPRAKPHRSFELDPKVDFSMPTVVAHQHDLHCDINFQLDTKPYAESTIRAAWSVWPIARESFYRIGSEPIVHLEPLLDPSAPLRAVSSLALMRSLGSGYAAERAGAVDVAIAAIGDGRWDADRMGELLAMRIIQAKRFSVSLAEVAGASALHALQILNTIEAAMARRPKKLPSTIGSLLDLTYELMVDLEVGLVDETAVLFLKSIKGTGKGAKAARQIMTFVPSGSDRLAPAYRLALTGRSASGRSLAN